MKQQLVQLAASAQVLASRTGTELATAGGLTAPEDTEAAGDLARRMDKIAKETKLIPKRVSQSMDTKGARALLDQAHKAINGDISHKSSY